MALRPDRFLKENAHPAANGSSSEWNQKRRVFRPWMGGLGVFLLAAVLLVRLLPQSDSVSSESGPGIGKSEESESATQTAPGGDQGAPAGASAETVDTSGGLVEPSLPTLETVKSEVVANPHQTPSSLRAFARGLSPWMRAALAEDASMEIIERTVGFLSRCAGVGEGGAGTVRSVRLVCLMNLRRIRDARLESHPAIAARVDRILAAAPAELIERIEQAGKWSGQGMSGEPSGTDSGEEAPHSH